MLVALTVVVIVVNTVVVVAVGSKYGVRETRVTSIIKISPSSRGTSRGNFPKLFNLSITACRNRF